MLVCPNPALVTWQPDFLPSQQPSPCWTRLCCDGVELSNGLEGVDWTTNPVQVVLCDACGHPGCGSGGFVHISRLGNFLWWTWPQVEPRDDWESGHYSPLHAVERSGSVLFSLDTWEALRARVPSLPGGQAFPRTTHQALLDAWSRDVYLGQRIERPEEVIPILRDGVLAADSLDSDSAISAVEEMMLIARRQGDRPVEGTLTRAEEAGVVLETLYFDGPPFQDWAAFGSARSERLFAFGGGWVLVQRTDPTAESGVAADAGPR